MTRYGPALILLGSYLAVSSGVDIFFYPKLVSIAVGATLCLLTPSNPAPLRPWFLISLGVAVLSAGLAPSPLQAFLGLFRSPTAGMLGAVACWLSYEAGSRHPGTGTWRYASWGAVLCAIGALATWIPGAPFHYMLPSGRAIGSIGSPPFLGCMLIATLPLVAVSAPRAATITVLCALLATESKAAVIGAAAGLYALLLLEKQVPRRTLLLAAGIPSVLVFWAFSRAGSDVMRICTWGIAWKAFLMRPWLGWGPDNFIDIFIRLRGTAWMEAAGGSGMTASENAHNLVLNLLVTQGFLGLCAHLALAAVAGNRLLARTDRESQCLVAGYVAVLAYSLFNPVPFMAWCVLGFMLGSLGI